MRGGLELPDGAPERAAVEVRDTVGELPSQVALPGAAAGGVVASICEDGDLGEEANRFVIEIRPESSSAPLEPRVEDSSGERFNVPDFPQTPWPAEEAHALDVAVTDNI